MDEAVGYTRISDDREGKAIGVGNQRTDIERKAIALGWTLTEVYQDNDITADPKKKERPDFQRLLADMASGKVKRVLCYDQDRLVRDMRELEDIVDAVEAGEVLLTSVNGDIDLRTDNGRYVARIKGATAKAELEKLSRRVRDNIRHSAEAGKKKQGKYRTFGYNRDMTTNDREAAAVKDAFTRKANGESLTSIATRFNAEGIPTTGGGTWDASGISKLIKRRDYIAQVTLNGDVVGGAKWDALVSNALWTKANTEAEKVHNRGRNARRSLLAGFLICDNCSTKMKQGGAKDAPRYNCPSPRAVVSACGSCSIVAPATDEAVFQAVYEHAQSKGSESASKAPVRDWRKEEAGILADIESTHALRRSGQLLLVDSVTIINDLRTQLAQMAKDEAAAMPIDLGVLQTGMDWFEWSLSEKRVYLDIHVEYVLCFKAERVGVKGFKPERLEIHYTDGRVQQLKKEEGVVVHRSSDPVEE